MPRPRSMRPTYAYHVSGQARVYLDGRYFYLGEFDSPKSHARYFSLCDEYHRNGQKIPEAAETHPDPDAVLTVRCVTADYREFVKTKFDHDVSRKNRFTNLCNTVDDEYADIAADDFGPRKLAAIRDLLLATKNRKGRHNSRGYINEQVRDIVRIFERAVSRELVRVETIIALRTLTPLVAGETDAHESDPVMPVDIETVRLTAKHLSPVIKSMVWLQAKLGMRPSELFRMRPCDIDTAIDDVWVYRPASRVIADQGRFLQ